MTALGLTVAAIVRPLEESESRSGRPKAAKQSVYPGGGAVARDGVASAPLEGAAEADDPFAPRSWLAPPPSPPPQVLVRQAPAAAMPPVPAGPPPLPYRFVGRMDGDGTEIIYLTRGGDQSIVARTGETLDSAYKVVTIDRQMIEFEHLPSGEKRRLPIPPSE
jgi:hypothetical protein